MSTPPVIFYSAADCFHRLSSERPRLLTLFLAWFYFVHPNMLSELARRKFADVLPAIGKLTRRDFFEEFRDTDFAPLFRRIDT